MSRLIENNRLEFKRVLNDSLEKEVVGFLNYHEGGEIRLVDPTALREAVINAIIHNEYTNGIPPVFEIFTDRFVITSSGGLPQELNQAEFFDGISAPRNKELMRVFKDVKLVEQLGSGVQRILKMYERSIFKFSPNVRYQSAEHH